MARLQEVGMKLKPEKPDFMVERLPYLGHEIMTKGSSPTSEKVDAIRNAHAPGNVSELQSFIGTANHSHFAEIKAPLYKLLKRDTLRQWTQPQQDAFNRIRNAIGSVDVLAHDFG